MGRGGSPVFVGRERELAALLGGFQDALEGRGRLFLVGGEPGIGKSRLAERVTEIARERGAQILWGRCWEAGGAPAYWPWVQSLRAAIRSPEPDALRAQVGSGARDIAQMLPEIRDILSDVEDPPTLDPDAARFRLFDATASFLRAVSADEPTVIVLEDLHAADKPSLLLLEFVARGLADARLLILGTYRDVEVDRSHPLTSTLVELRREGATRALTLSGLREADVGLFIEETAGVRPSPQLVGALARETEGNPLFVGEIVRLLASEGRLDAAMDASALRRVPQGVRDVIGRRIDHLSERCNHVLTVASVLGRDFALDVLERLSERPADELLEILDEAIGARVVVEGTGGLGSMRFSHSLIRDTLYEELSSVRRVRLHRRAGEIFEELSRKDGERLAELAYHFFVAAPTGGAEKAVAYAKAGGDHAIGQLAYEEAARLYDMALQGLALSDEDDEMLRCDLLLRLGDAQARSGDIPAARQTFLEAAGTAKRNGLSEHLGRAALGFGGRFVFTRSAGAPGLVPLIEDALREIGEEDTPLRARLLARLAGALRDRHEREPRESLSAEAVAIARRTGDLGALAWALAGRYSAIWYPDNADERLEIVDELLRVAEEAGERQEILQGHLWRWTTLLELGDLHAVRRESEAIADLTGELREGSHLWLEAGLRASMALFEGHFEEAERMIPEAMVRGERAQNWEATAAHHMQIYHLSRERGGLDEVEPTIREAAAFFTVYPMFKAALAELLVTLGRREEAAALVEELAADDFGLFLWDNEWIFGMVLLAEAIAGLGDRARAAPMYERLRPFEHRNAVAPSEGVLGSVARPLGMLATVLGRYDEAEQHFQSAVRQNQRMGAPPWVARSQYEYAKMLLDRDRPGDREMAKELLSAASTTTRELGMPPLAQAIGALLGDRSVPGSAVPTGTVLRREGEYFSVSWEGDAFRLKDSKGLRYLAVLLASPGREHHAMDLVAAIEGVTPADAAVEAGAVHAAPGDAGEVLDRSARAAYKQRLADLEEEIEEARAFGDGERAARAQEQRDFLVAELAAGTGLGGRSRRAASDAERARVNVTRAIRSALARIADHSPTLRAHLEATVSTGTFCSYTPDPRVPVAWQL